MNTIPFLGSMDERVKLLKVGFTGKQIEALYLFLNSFEVTGINLQD